MCAGEKVLVRGKKTGFEILLLLSQNFDFKRMLSMKKEENLKKQDFPEIGRTERKNLMITVIMMK